VGAPGLRAALMRKLREDTGLDLTNQEVMITAGANQVRVRRESRLSACLVDSRE
jgi:aspartate/methionine/tyrosine aminotransferase